MEPEENRTNRQTIAIVIVGLLLLGSLGVLLMMDSDEKKSNPQYQEVPEDYMVLVEAPQSEEDLALIATLSSFIAPTDEEFHPFFILEDGALDDHSLWTIDHHEEADVDKYLFYRSPSTATTVSGQVSNVRPYNMTKESVNEFMRTLPGRVGEISVGSFEEALWAAPLAKVRNQVLVYDRSTFDSQEQVWQAMGQEKAWADYVLVVNPEDLNDFEGYDSTNGNVVSYHIPWLSAVGGAIGAHHSAYVVTDITVPEKGDSIWNEWAYVLPTDSGNTPGFDDSTLNDYPVGLLAQLREINDLYGPIDNIALLGSAEAVPQWELVDHSDSEPDYVSSDLIYGFIDQDHNQMDVPVGRFINYNVQGMANQVTRTFTFDRILPDVTVQYQDGEETYPWRTTGADLNGFEVADMRLQNTPGLWAVRDYEDEQFTDVHYVNTWGIGASYNGGTPEDLPTDSDINAYVQSAGHILYRGHGSWHGGFYTYRYYEPTGAGGAGHVEGSDARQLFLPPQSTSLFSCENTKIHGLSYGGDPIEMDRAFATNWMYAGAVGLVGATEVSYSNIGQDAGGVVGEVTGEHEWDLNNLWFAGMADKTLDDEMTLGQAVMNTENRYMTYHNYEFTPVKGDGAHWKEIIMYALLGDPAFQYYVTVPGEEDYNPWH